MKQIQTKHILLAFLCLITLVVIAANPSFNDFVTSQFITTGNKVAIKNGVLLTNPVVSLGTLTGDVAGATNANATTLFGSGTVPTARLGSGTANAGTFLAGDQSWKVVAASGNLVAEGTNGITAVTNGQLVTISFNGLNVVLSNASFQGPFTGVGAAAGKVVLNSGSGTGGYFDYSGATASNHLVAMVDGRFVDGGSTNAGGSQVFTNANGFIWESGHVPPDPTGMVDGPPFFFRTNDGSLFIGPQVGQDGGVGNTSTTYPIYSFVTTTNGPVSSVIDMVSANSENYDYYAQVFLNTDNDTTNGAFISTLKLASQADNGKSIKLQMDVGFDYLFGDKRPINLSTNNVDAATLDTNGLWTANGFTDKSGTPGSLVAYQGGNRLGPTNITAVIENNYFTNLNVTNITVYDSVVVNTNVTIKGNVTVNNITVTNGITNLNLTANSIVKTDANKALASQANGTGVLTNNGSGTFGWVSTYANTVGNNAFTTASSNYFALNVTTSTNQNQIKPDFSVAEQLITTNAAFTFLAPVGVDTTLTTAQWTLVHVTNTTSSAVLITSPANCHTVGTAYVTNLTDVWFNCYASKFTNAFYVPVF